MKLPEPMHLTYQPPKAIPTKYRFHLFRSRLEAIWAKFFTDLGIRWTWEPEGYSLPSTGYIPDFMLVGQCSGWRDLEKAIPEPIRFRMFCEVKHHGVTDEAWRKAVEFSMTTPIVLLEGKPDAQTYPAIFRGKLSYSVIFRKNGLWLTKLPPNDPIEIDDELAEAIEAACSERFGT